VSSPAGQAQETVALSGGRSMRAALRHPSAAAPRGGWPGVLVVHELFGLTPEIVAVGDRFADRGWVAAVPDLFSSGVRVGCLVRALREVSGGRAAGMTDDLRAVLDWLGEQPDVDASRTAVIGLCMGGAFALLLGSLGPEGLRAVSDNYGAPPAADLDLTRCPPVLLNYGGRDPALGKQGPKIAAAAGRRRGGRREDLPECGAQLPDPRPQAVRHRANPPHLLRRRRGPGRVGPHLHVPGAAHRPGILTPGVLARECLAPAAGGRRGRGRNRAEPHGR